MSFVKLSRTLFASELWRRQKVYSEVSAYIDLLQMAAYRDVTVNINGDCITCHPDEIVTTYSFLATRWKWNRNKVSRFFIKLAKMHWLAYSGYKMKYTIITILMPEKNEHEGVIELSIDNAHTINGLNNACEIDGGTRSEHNTKNNKEENINSGGNKNFSRKNYSSSNTQNNGNNHQRPATNHAGSEERTTEFLRSMLQRSGIFVDAQSE